MKYIVISFLIILSSCSNHSIESKKKPKIKNIILIIGDGMGPQQLGLLQLYAKNAKSSSYENGKSYFEQIADKGEVGLVEVNPHDYLVTDSACSATQYATGEYGLPEAIGLNQDGIPVPNIIDLAKSLNKSTGVVSDARITHATPASFYAQIDHRNRENDIAVQAVESNVDILLGGGLRQFIPKNYTEEFRFKKNIPEYVKLYSKRKDNKNILKKAFDNGYTLAFDKKSLFNIKEDKVLGLFSVSGMPNEIEYREKEVNDTPTLKEMTKVALKKLDKNPNGFFLMVEAGQIDWSGHQNDAGLMLGEMLKMDKMLLEVLEYAKNRDDTLVVITADHETGSFGFSYNTDTENNKLKKVNKVFFKNGEYRPRHNYGDFDNLDLLYKQRKSFVQIYDDWMKLSNQDKTPSRLVEMINSISEFKINLKDASRILKIEEFQKDTSTYPYERNAFSALIGKAVSKKQNVVWGTGAHTSTPVVLAAFGPKIMTKKFGGIHHSSEIGKILLGIFKDTAD